MLNVAFLIDITGSMSCELDGLKDTVGRLVSTVFNDFPGELVVTVITFTEDDKGCYVTRNSFTDGPEAAQFVRGIKLCVPPGQPHVNASGGDGPENHKAALAELLRLDADVPTVAFLISDAVPHLLDVRSTEATLERNYLSHEFGITDSDLFGLLDRLVAHFGDNLVLSVVKYYQTTDHALYGALAKKLSGVLVTPVKRTAQELADGLMAILMQMFQSLAGTAMTAPSDNAETAAALSAFSFYDLEPIEVPSSERFRAAIATPVVGSTDELLFKLVERTTVIAGGKFKKRAITAHLVSEQVELLLVLAKGLLREISKDEALTRATLLLEKIRALMGEEHASQFKFRVDELDALLSNEAFAKVSAPEEFEAAVSAITLMSIEETARDISFDGEDAEHAPEPRDPYESLLAVASLFLGHLAVLQLPTRLGVVDFMDAWSAVIQKVSNDVVSAADFLTMIGDKESVAGLRLRDTEYNFLQLVADPNDAVGSELLRVASGTQVLDILTALLSGAPAGLFSPNMFRGTIAASLMTLLSTHEEGELSAYQWAIARKMVHTVRLLMGATPATVALEPESAMGKLLFRVLRVPVATLREDEPALRGFLEEMAAARAQKFAKYNERAYLELVESVTGYTHDETAVAMDAFAPHVLLDGETLPLDAAHAVATVQKSAFCRNFEMSARNVLRAVFGGDEDDFTRVPSLTQVWPSYTHDLPKLLLLVKRTERYTLQKEDDVEAKAESKGSWVRNETVMADPLDSSVFVSRALTLLRQKYDAFIRATRQQRQDEVAQERWRRVVMLVRSPLETFVAQLATIVTSSSRREHKLLLQALAKFGPELDAREYEAKVTVVITGRVVDEDDATRDRVVFNRGNLHAHPTRYVPMSKEFRRKLRNWQRTRKWSPAHVYRESGEPNHSGHSNANPSAWAARRSDSERTFWERDD